MNNLPLGANEDSNAPWHINDTKPTKFFEDIPIWVDEDKQELFKFDFEVLESNEGDDIKIVVHCYGKRKLPDTYQIDVEDSLQEEYGARAIIEFDSQNYV